MALRKEENAYSLEQRLLRGESLRKHMPRVAQAAFHPKQRKHSPLDLLLAHVRGRLPAQLRIRWSRMAASPFGYFRGNIAVWAADLAQCGATGFHVQMYGDAHVRNLGAYAVHDDRLVFDANDFDETLPGPWEWDLKRMATSILLAGREAGHTDAACKEAALSFLADYRRRTTEYASAPFLELARTYCHKHLASEPIAEALKKAERRSPLANLEKLTRPAAHGVRVFVQNKPLLWRLSPARAREVIAGLRAYRENLADDARSVYDRYRPLDVCFKVVGTGSVGARDYVVLLLGNGEHDPLFLQIKEEPPSAYAAHLPAATQAGNQGQRVVTGQRRLQAESDPLLGWTSMHGRDYLVRQLADHKATPAPEDLAGDGLVDYALVCGEVMAKGHARAGDAAVISGYVGRGAKFDHAIARFAEDYASQVTKDHAQLLAAIRSGRLRAQRGV